MSVTEDQVVETVGRVSVSRLRTWVRLGWVRPQSAGGTHTYSEADIARICLLCELRDELNINNEALPVVLSLIDQIHGLRRQLKVLGSAVEAQPKSVQEAIKTAFQALSRD